MSKLYFNYIYMCQKRTLNSFMGIAVYMYGPEGLNFSDFSLFGEKNLNFMLFFWYWFGVREKKCWSGP